MYRSLPSFNNFYTPRLLSLLFDDVVGETSDLQNMISRSPSVKIVDPQDGFSSKSKDITIEAKAIQNGDPISEILLYVNGKLTGGDERGFKVSGESKSFTEYSDITCQYELA